MVAADGIIGDARACVVINGKRLVAWSLDVGWRDATDDNRQPDDDGSLLTHHYLPGSTAHQRTTDNNKDLASVVLLE